MKLSLIVPVYNTRDYVSECLESLIGQTWRDIEIICVNDGSTDDSARILQEYAWRDERISILTQENRGLSAARNAGLRAARGEYVLFVDSDDRLEGTACERLVYEIVGKEPDLIVFGANTIPAAALEADKWLKAVLSPNDVMIRGGALHEVMLQPGAWPFVWRNCIRRGLLESEGLTFDESVRYGEDTLFQLCLLPACRRISFISDRLYDYRKGRAGSLMERLQQGWEKRASFHLPLVERAADYWRVKGWMTRWGEVFLGWSLEFVAYDVTRAEPEKRREYAERLLKLWHDNGLDAERRTRCGQTFELMVESVCGRHRVRSVLMRLTRNGMLRAIALYRRLKHIA